MLCCALQQLFTYRPTDQQSLSSFAALFQLHFNDLRTVISLTDGLWFTFVQVCTCTAQLLLIYDFTPRKWNMHTCLTVFYLGRVQLAAYVSTEGNGNQVQWETHLYVQTQMSDNMLIVCQQQSEHRYTLLTQGSTKACTRVITLTVKLYLQFYWQLSEPQ